MGRKKNKTSKKSDAQLIEEAIQLARKERKQMEKNKTAQASQKTRQEVERMKIEEEGRMRSFAQADSANLPHASFMELPCHPDDIAHNEHKDSIEKLLAKPAGDGEVVQGSRKERAAYARAMARWKRNGYRGDKPQAPAERATDKRSVDEFAESPTLQQAQRFEYARWILNQYKTLPTDFQPAQFTFNVIADRRLGSETVLHVCLVPSDGCVYVLFTHHQDGISQAIRQKSLEAILGPDNLLLVQEGGTVPRTKTQIKLPGVRNLSGARFRRGIPSALVLHGRGWPGDLPEL